MKRAQAWALLIVSIGLCIATLEGVGAPESEEAGQELQSYFSNANTTGGQAFVNITAPPIVSQFEFVHLTKSLMTIVSAMTATTQPKRSTDKGIELRFLSFVHGFI
jgi:hypothetical protein